RLGADEVSIIYRRGESEMPARAEELHHAKEEGIILRTLTNPKEINADENGNAVSLTCVKMELGEPDESGRRRPVEVAGSEHIVEADTVIMAIGTSPNPLLRTTTEGLEANKHGCLIVREESTATTRDGVFAGGDAVSGAATVILAMGAGKQAADEIDKYIKAK
nr:FAD-dependent oxidoreductase [Clostridia bacterium]